MPNLTGIEMIILERKDHFEKHGFTIESDAEKYPNGQLLDAVLAIITMEIDDFPASWDTDLCNKVMRKTPSERWAVAASLLAAQIDINNAKNINATIE